MKELGLFAGIGGFSLGLKWAGFETVALCEIDKKCQLVLKKHWPNVPIYENVRDLTYEKLKADGIGTIDIVTGGFPCQPYSLAGKRKGKEDDRHLWPEMLRIIKEVKPTWVIGENTPGIVSMELDNVLVDLENIGYPATPYNIPACGVGAFHKRERIWIVAHSSSDGTWRKAETGFSFESDKSDKRLEKRWFKKLSNPNKQHDDDWRHGASEICGERSEETELQRGEQYLRNSKGFEGVSRGPQENHWSDIEPPVCGVVNGFPGRVDRLKQLGNAVVPQIPYLIGMAIMEAEKQ